MKRAVTLLPLLLLVACGGGGDADAGDGKTKGAVIDQSVCRESGEKIRAAGNAVGAIADKTGTVGDAAAALLAARDQLQNDAPLAKDPALKTQVTKTADSLGRLRVALSTGADFNPPAQTAVQDIAGFTAVCDPIVNGR